MKKYNIKLTEAETQYIIEHKLYRLSLSQESYDKPVIICDDVLNSSIVFCEFMDFDEAIHYLNTSFKMIGEGKNYNYYIRTI